MIFMNYERYLSTYSLIDRSTSLFHPILSGLYLLNLHPIMMLLDCNVSNNMIIIHSFSTCMSLQQIIFSVKQKSRRCHGTGSDRYENDKSGSLNTESLQTGTEIFLLVTKLRLLETATFSNREHFKLLIDLSNNSLLC